MFPWQMIHWCTSKVHRSTVNWKIQSWTRNNADGPQTKIMIFPKIQWLAQHFETKIMPPWRIWEGSPAHGKVHDSCVTQNGSMIDAKFQRLTHIFWANGHIVNKVYAICVMWPCDSGKGSQNLETHGKLFAQYKIEEASTLIIFCSCFHFITEIVHVHFLCSEIEVYLQNNSRCAMRSKYRCIYMFDRKCLK